MSKQLTKIKLSVLKTNPLQQSKRTTKKALRELKAQIEAFGLKEPITVTTDGTIVEGHRRVAVASELGWTEIDAFIDTEASYMDLVFQGGKKPLNAGSMLHAWGNARPEERGQVLARMPTRTAKSIQFLIDTYGAEDLFLKLCEDDGYSASLSNYIQIVKTNLAAHGLKPVPERVIGDWIVKFRFGVKISAVKRIASKYGWAQFRKALTDDVDFPPDRWIQRRTSRKAQPV